MKFKQANIGNLKYGLFEICMLDLIAKTAYWLGKFQTKVEAEHKEYTKQVNKLRDKYGKYKYKFEKDVVKDNKPAKDTEICTLEGPEGHKYLVDGKGKKVEGHEVDWDKVYWEPNSDKDMESFNGEMEALNEIEFEIPYDPIPLNRLIRKNAEGKEEEINIKPAILSMLDGVIEDIGEEKEPKAPETPKSSSNLKRVK
jgi:hypothetical protein